MLTDKDIEKMVENTNERVEYYKLLMRFSFKLVHRFNDFWKEVLEGYGLNQTEFLILGVVCDNPGLSQQEIVQIVGADKSIVSRNIKRLEKNGLVSRKPNMEYNHGYFCETTDYGKKIYEEIHQNGDPIIEKRFSLVTKEELKNTKEILAKIWGDIY